MAVRRRSAVRMLAALAGAWLALAPAAAKEPASVSLAATPAPGRMDQPVTLTAATGLLFDASGLGKVDGGYEHSCAVTAAGGVMCWGYNWSGQLGDGTTTDRGWPVAVAGVGGAGPLVGATAVATGASHACALLADATVACWGRNVEKQLGADTPDTVQPTPVKVAGLAGVMAIAAGSYHSCALLGDGTVRCWGENNDGKLGRGFAGVDEPTPAPVVGPAGSGLAQLGGVVAIAAGGDHTCALGAGGAVHCWGRNSSGQVGTGMAGSADVTAPVAVVGPDNSVAPLAGAVAIDAGYDHTCAALSSGQVVCWGDNDDGQLGDGTTNDRAFPSAAKGIGGVDTLTGAVEVALGDDHSCARTAAGEVRCWGYGGYGQLGGGNLVDSLVPVAVTGLPAAAVDLAAGDWHACALLADGRLRCWGGGWYGQLGDGGTSYRAVPGPVTAGGGPLAAGAVSAGGWTTCAIVAGGVRCWGYGEYGQLGDGSTVRDSAVPLAVKAGPGLSADLAGAVEVAVGEYHACARMADGGVKCWGRNDAGQLGDGYNVPSSPAPVGVNLGGPASAIVAGATHACAIVGDGARCWGLNDDGQLGNGDGNLVSSSTPVEVKDLLGKVIALAAGNFHTCALVQGAKNSVYCWGSNADGQLGVDPAVSPKLLSPAQPAFIGFLDVGPVSIAAGGAHSCAVDSLDHLQCWGANNNGQLGDGKTVSRHLRKHVVVEGGAELADVVAVEAGHGHTCAQLSSGALRCWGSNSDGQLGTGDTVSSLHPIAVVGPSGQELAVTSVSAGSIHTCGITSGGVAQCWGNRYNGQLGDGVLGYATSPVAAGPVPTGTVTFTNRGEAIGAAALVDGVATLAVTLPANLHRLAAAFPGDATFEAAVSAAVDLLVTGTPGADRIAGTNAADTLVAGGGRDVIRGGGGADAIDGGGGNDRIEGGPGRDRLTGGAGKDVFVFRKAADSRAKKPDVITDFRKGDRLDLSAFARAADVRFRRKGSRLEVYRNGDGKPEFAVVLKGVKRLPAGAVKAKK